MTRRPRRSDHFTCRLWWRFIEKEGIRHGEVPIGGGRLLDHPNLTTDPGPAHQGRATRGGEVARIGGRRVVRAANQDAVRISVGVAGRDPELVRWVDLARGTGMDE